MCGGRCRHGRIGIGLRKMYRRRMQSWQHFCVVWLKPSTPKQPLLLFHQHLSTTEMARWVAHGCIWWWVPRKCRLAGLRHLAATLELNTQLNHPCVLLPVQEYARLGGSIIVGDTLYLVHYQQVLDAKIGSYQLEFRPSCVFDLHWKLHRIR